MRGVFEKVKASTQYLIAYEIETFNYLSVCMDSVFLCTLPYELQDENRDAGALYHRQHCEQGFGCQLAGAVYISLRADGYIP